MNLHRKLITTVLIFAILLEFTLPGYALTGTTSLTETKTASTPYTDYPNFGNLEREFTITQQVTWNKYKWDRVTYIKEITQFTISISDEYVKLTDPNGQCASINKDKFGYGKIITAILSIYSSSGSLINTYSMEVWNVIDTSGQKWDGNPNPHSLSINVNAGEDGFGGYPILHISVSITFTYSLPCAYPYGPLVYDAFTLTSIYF